MNWQERAAQHLRIKYAFPLAEANDLADTLFYNDDSQDYEPEEYVDEEMTYWGD